MQILSFARARFQRLTTDGIIYFLRAFKTTNIHDCMYHCCYKWRICCKMLHITRNSAIADKPCDAFVQMQWRGWP